ncbi:hypothetical protein [Steroidobacter sp.]|uniref:hypothetical protein n=1 Tax=Steroidobacter sp. TaxID=1978227 RepID=UPI001A434305|nr:hypothetical protein [Steroidobacter sp.]MBL8265324.1 hypothetical protein [Steroidobacter sp.]
MSTQSSSAGSGPERRIALIKPSGGEEQAAHAVQLFDSVLWVFKGTTRSNWITTPAASADIVVVHHSEPANNLDRWTQQGKHIVVLSTDEKRHPAGPRTLVYPFPAVQVLSMLERVEAEMETRASTHTPTPAAPPPAPLKEKASKAGADPWSFVEALRTLRTVNNGSLWLMCKGAQGPFLWLRGDVGRYVCDGATAAAIRADTLDLSGLALQKGTPPPGNLPARPGDELFWFATYHASTSLAPWLNDKTLYRLIRWPDFGRLRVADAVELTAQLRIVAALETGAATLGKLAAQAQASVDQVARTLNALASCALIEAAQVVSPPPKATRTEPSAPTPTGGFKQFLRNMRKHLRIGGL